MAFGHRRASECERTRSLLSAHIDERLAPAEERALQAHLSACPACAEELRTLRLTVSMLGQMPRVAVPRSFIIEAPAPAVRRFSAWYYYFRNASGAVAALLIALLAFTYVVQSGLTGIPGDASKTSVAGAPAPEAQGVLRAKQPGDQTGSYATPVPRSDATAPAVGQLKEGAPSDTAGGAPAPAGAARPAAAAPTAAAAAPLAPGAATAEQDAAKTSPPPPTAEAGPPPSWILTGEQDTGEPAVQAPEAQPTERPRWPLAELAYAMGGLLVVLLAATVVARRKSTA